MKNVFWIILPMLLAGCATKPIAKSNYFFFPPPPDEPRIQYLTSFGSERDLGSKSSFAAFVTGGQLLDRPIIKPYGIAVSKGQLHVCDSQLACVADVDLAKRKIQYFKPQGQAGLSIPIGVAVDTDGTRYITDTKRMQVLIYDPAGGLIAALGKKDEMKPCGVVVAGDRFYVSDLRNHCVRVYRKANRELLFTVPRDGTDEKFKLFQPTNLAVDQQGRMYVSDTGGFAIQVFAADGKHLRTIGEQGLEPGHFALTKGIGVDHAGRVYVVDAATAIVQLFDDQGRTLMYFGDPKTSGPAGLYLPAGLAIDYDNVEFFQQYVAPGNRIEFLILVTNQAGTQKVSVYGFLAKK